MRALVRRGRLPRRGRVSAAGQCNLRLRLHLRHGVCGRTVCRRWWRVVPRAAGAVTTAANPSATFANATSTAAATSTAHGACLSLDLFDEFGDGWGATVLSVRTIDRPTDEAVDAMAMAAGRYYEQRHVCLGEGCYALRAQGTEHLDEISWELHSCGQASSGPMLSGSEVRLCIEIKAQRVTCSSHPSAPPPDEPPPVPPSAPPPPSTPPVVSPPPLPSPPPSPSPACPPAVPADQPQRRRHRLCHRRLRRLHPPRRLTHLALRASAREPPIHRRPPCHRHRRHLRCLHRRRRLASPLHPLPGLRRRRRSHGHRHRPNLAPRHPRASPARMLRRPLRLQKRRRPCRRRSRRFLRATLSLPPWRPLWRAARTRAASDVAHDIDFGSLYKVALQNLIALVAAATDGSRCAWTLAP